MRLACLPLLFLSLPAAAETDIRGAIIAMAQGGNCTVTEDAAEIAFAALGLTRDEVRPVAEAMIAAGEASLGEGGLHLSPTLCTATAAPAAPPTPVVSPLMGRVIAVFAANGCALTEDQGLPRMAAAGITEADLDTLRDETEHLVEAGLMIRDEATRTITINPPLCAGATVAADPADPLIRMLRENGCSLTQESAAGLVGAYGVTMQALDQMADSLMDRGLADVNGGALVLRGCGG